MRTSRSPWRGKQRRLVQSSTEACATFLPGPPSHAHHLCMIAVVRPILARRSPPLLPPRVTSATRPTPPTLDHHAPDRVALDRRAGPRGDDRPLSIDRFTAATHRPLPLLLGLGAMGRW